MFARAREKARQTSCLSNLKQIGLAEAQYSIDYDDSSLPVYIVDPRTSGQLLFWATLLQPYAKNMQIMSCPSDEGDYAPATWVSPYNADIINGVCTYSYAINWINTWDGSVSAWAGTSNHTGPHYPGTKLASIGSPAETISFVEGTANEFWSSAHLEQHLNAGVARHNMQQNILFCDGHAKSMAKTRTHPAMYTVQDDVTPAGWGPPANSNW